MDAFIGQRFEDFETIAGVNDVKFYGRVPPFTCSIEMLSGFFMNFSLI